MDDAGGKKNEIIPKDIHKKEGDTKDPAVIPFSFKMGGGKFCFNDIINGPRTHARQNKTHSFTRININEKKNIRETRGKIRIGVYMI